MVQLAQFVLALICVSRLCAQTVEIPGLGTAEGFILDRVEHFLGLQFATADRFEPAQPVTTWESNPYDATSFGPQCPQSTYTRVFQDISIIMEEECLYLNVYRPANTLLDDNLTVMVFLHGGGLYQGAPHLYDPHLTLVPKGMIVVTVAYRLGLLGSIEPSPSGAYSGGNLNLGDMVAALQWVQDHIAAFGGDPSLVTLTGHNAGAIAVCNLLVNPLFQSQGLFSQAVMLSGNCWTGDIPTIGASVAASLGVAEEELLTVPVDDILQNPEAMGSQYLFFRDGVTMDDNFPLSHKDHNFNSDEYTGLTISADAVIISVTSLDGIGVALEPVLYGSVDTETFPPMPSKLDYRIERQAFKQSLATTPPVAGSSISPLGEVLAGEALERLAPLGSVWEAYEAIDVVMTCPSMYLAQGLSQNDVDTRSMVYYGTGFDQTAKHGQDLLGYFTMPTFFRDAYSVTDHVEFDEAAQELLASFVRRDTENAVLNTWTLMDTQDLPYLQLGKIKMDDDTGLFPVADGFPGTDLLGSLDVCWWFHPLRNVSNTLINAFASASPELASPIWRNAVRIGKEIAKDNNNTDNYPAHPPDTEYYNMVWFVIIGLLALFIGCFFFSTYIKLPETESMKMSTPSESELDNSGSQLLDGDML